MRTILTLLAGALAAIVVVVVVGLVYLRVTGVRARVDPGTSEAQVARWLHGFAIPSEARAQRSPVPPSADALADGQAHFADHCAVCHGNDGSGDTEMGRGLYPRPPDMRMAATQQLTDGELFYIIENGVRFTGMPGFGTNSAAGAESTWRLVQFVRHLPQLTADEIEQMKQMNPRSPEEIKQELEEEKFLNEGADK